VTFKQISRRLIWSVQEIMSRKLHFVKSIYALAILEVSQNKMHLWKTSTKGAKANLYDIALDSQHKTLHSMIPIQAWMTMNVPAIPNCKPKHLTATVLPNWK